MARLADLMNQQPNNGWISMAELDALEQAQRGQRPMINNASMAQIGPGQGSFQRSGGNQFNMTPMGWQDSTQPEMAGPPQMQTQSQQLDYANPIDYMGAKGYRLKGDSGRVMLNDGRMVSLTPQADAAKAGARQKAEGAQLDMDLKRATLAEKTGGGVDGKAPAGYRWTSGGNMEPIPGGPADMKAQALSGQKAAGAADVDSAVASLRDAYDRLEQGGGITSTKRGALENLSAASSSSALGQAAGRMFGTQNQSARNDIAMTRPALLAALMKATGMSAKQMDSNAELKLWMTTATDPTLDVESNRRALAAIERKYLGTGQPAGGDPGGGQGGPRRVASDADYNSLPSGSTYIDPNGNTRTKR